MNKRMAPLFVILALLAFSVAAMGCPPPPVVEPPIEPLFTIYVVVHGGIADPFWLVVERGAMDAEAMLPVEVIFTGPPVFCLVDFMADVEAAIAADPDGLVVTLTAPEAMDEPLRAAMAAELPVIAINAPDLRMPPEVRIPVLTYIGEDSYYIGVVAARETLERFTPTRAVFFHHHPGAVHIDQRGFGYVDTMRAAGIPVEMVDITTCPVKGAEIALAYLLANPDVDAIFCSSTIHTETIIPHLLEAGIRVGVDVKIAQMDLSPGVLDYIVEGKIMFTMDQQQYLQGFWGVQFMYLYLRYGFVPPPVPVSTGPAVVTAEDVPMLKELVAAGYR